MTTDKKLSLGSWSEGSTRTEDIAQAAMDMADGLGIGDSDDDCVWLSQWMDHDQDECGESGCYYCEAGSADDVLTTLINTLDEYAPIYCYVGMAEGDGASFGVWPAHDSIQDAIRNAHTLADGRLLNITDMVIIDISDHGNVEVYAIERGASLLSLV